MTSGPELSHCHASLDSSLHENNIIAILGKRAVTASLGMAEANNSQWDASPLAPARPQSRRKIRRGTISCWECKRRKIRCAFASPVDTVCNGCQRRGTKCISQDLPDHPEPPHSESLREMGSRMSRMEALIERLTARLDGEPRTSGVSENASNEMEIDIQATSRSWPTAHHVNTTAPVQVLEQLKPPRDTTVSNTSIGPSFMSSITV